MSPNNASSGKSNEVISERTQEEKPREVGEWKRAEGSVLGRDHGHGHGRTVHSLIGELLCDIYGTSGATKQTSASDRGDEVQAILQLMAKDTISLEMEKKNLEKRIAEEGNELIQQLKKKNFLLMKREAHCDLITAYIQAVSSKTREDTKMKFSLSPNAETGFSQWLDAMRMVAQLPGGMPSEFRTKLWLQLSEKHLNDEKIDWEKAEAIIFNEWTNPDDEELGVQIVKDLHRTGCSLFCGEQEHNQALLKRVLLAYARWNKNVGYCQGFNMLAALILQVMDKNEKNAVKVMIYLIEGVLPESYFANNLRGLSVDMAVFRDLLRLRLPKLSKHLEALQHDTTSGTNYEPPLTNVFTMQWFLTLFSNCLPHQTVLRVWDLVFLYGNEVLLRTALAIWTILQDRVISVESADEFYSIMGVVTREMLEFGLMDANTLVKKIAMIDPFPNELQELREKYLYNISPWNQSVQCAAKKGIKLFYSDADDQDDTEDEDKIALTTAYGVFRRRESSNRELQISIPTLDIGILKQQYAKLRQRQRQAHVIITAACSSTLSSNIASGPGVSVNHLLMGKSALMNKERRIGPPEGSIPPSSDRKVNVQDEKNIDRGKSYRWKDLKHQSKDKKAKGKKLVHTVDGGTKTESESEDMKMSAIIDRMEGSLDGTEEESDDSSTSTELCDEEVSDGEELRKEPLWYSSSFSSRKDREIFMEETVPEQFLDARPPFFQPEDCENSINNSVCDNNNSSTLIKLNNLAKRAMQEGDAGEEVENFEEELQDIRNVEVTSVMEEDDKILRNDSKTDVQTMKFDNTINVIPKLEYTETPSMPFDNIDAENDETKVPINRKVMENSPKEISIAKSNNLIDLTVDNNTGKKSDIGLSVIRENLQMLHKFYASRTAEKEAFVIDREKEFKSNEEEKACENCSEEDEQSTFKKEYLAERKEETIKSRIDMASSDFTETEVPMIFPLSHKSVANNSDVMFSLDKNNSKALKLDKEVNTEITFGVGEFRIPSKITLLKVDEGKKFFPDHEFSAAGKLQAHRTFFEDEDADEVKTKIEISKNDWELKMKKIAELETTTRETFDEMHVQSMDHFRSIGGSVPIDETNSNQGLSERVNLRENSMNLSINHPRNRLPLELSEESDRKKTENSNSLFDVITSRTEKLLKKDEFGRSTNRLSSDADEEWSHRRSTRSLLSSSNSKSEDGFREASSKPRTSHFRSSSILPKQSTPGTERRGSSEPEGKSLKSLTKDIEKDLEEGGERAYSFNPFPTRSTSRSKELAIKFGLYQTYLQGSSKKS